MSLNLINVREKFRIALDWKTMKQYGTLRKHTIIIMAAYRWTGVSTDGQNGITPAIRPTI